MEKKQKVAPESSQPGEPPLKQHKSEAEQENLPVQEEKENLPVQENLPTPEMQYEAVRSFGLVGGSSGFGQEPDYGLGIRPFGSTYLTSVQKQYEAVRSFGSTSPTGVPKQLEATSPTSLRKKLEAVGFFGNSFRIWKQKLQTDPFRSATSTPASVSTSSLDVYSRVSHPAITEEDGGTSGQTAKLESISAMHAYKYGRFESCFAIAGANYCVIAADFTRNHTKISKLSQKSAMASGGFPADDLKALQEVLSAENLKYEGQHKKPMSFSEMRRPLCHHIWERRPKYGFIVLGGLDSEGKGRVFTLFSADTVASGVGYSSQYSGSRLIEPPIFKYELPARDVVAQLSETEAVDLAKKLFASSTHTGDMLEIVVLNASGLDPKYVDLRKDCDRC